MKKKLLLILIGMLMFSIFITGCAGGVSFPDVTESGVVVQIAGRGRPMENVPLSVRITNNTTDFISDVKVKLISIDNRSDLSPFELWKGTREVDVKEIAKTAIIESGKSVTATFTITSYDYINTRAYPVTVQMSYKDDNGALQTTTKNGIIDLVVPNKFYKAMRDIIEFIHRFIPNYGLAIILVTLLLKIFTHPLTKKQFKSTAGMTKLQPEIKKIQKKYKNDPQTANKETMKLYKEHNVSMFGGCLPLLVQWPLLLVLFGSLTNYAPFNLERFLWLGNLNTPDPFYIMSALVLISMFVQSKTSQMPGQVQDQNTKMMMYFLPVIFAVWSIKWAPSLLLYWITFSFVQAGEQLYILKHLSKVIQEIPKKDKKGK
jgi:YidC/Oxa1 family membrane protein insertase